MADEVGVGKTLSMATSALVSALLDDGPVLILAPSTLTIQWQIEMMDKLGVPAAVWSSQKKVWLGVEGKYSHLEVMPPLSKNALIELPLSLPD